MPSTAPAEPIPETAEAQEAGVEAETLVVASDHGHVPAAPVEPREPTEAEAQGLKDAMEVRVAELVAFCRHEAARYGADPKPLAREIADKLQASFED